MDLGLFLGGFQQGLDERRTSDRKDEIAAEEKRKNLAAEDLARQKFSEEKRSTGVNEQIARAKLRLAEIESQGNVQDRANRVLGELVGSIKDTVTAFRSAGKSQADIEAAVAPLAAKAVSLTGKLGVDPDLISARLGAIVSAPGTPQTEIGKLEADRRAGYLSDTDYRAKVEALSKPKSPFADELAKKGADELFKRRDVAIGAMQTLDANQTARQLLDSGIVSGIGADYIMSFGKALQQAGLGIGKDAIANTEAFVALRSKEVANVVKQFGAGAGISNADREYALKAAAGEVSLTESSIRKILELHDATSRAAIKSYNDSVKQLDPGVVPFDLRLPEVPSSAAPVERKVINGVTYEMRNGNLFRLPSAGIPQGR